MYQQQKCYNTAMNKFKRTGVARAASSFNAFAIATLSSFNMFCLFVAQLLVHFVFCCPVFYK